MNYINQYIQDVTVISWAMQTWEFRGLYEKKEDYIFSVCVDFTESHSKHKTLKMKMSH